MHSLFLSHIDQNQFKRLLGLFTSIITRHNILVKDVLVAVRLTIVPIEDPYLKYSP